MLYGPLVSAQQPALEQGHHPVDAGQQVPVIVTLSALDPAIMPITLQPAIGVERVGANGGARFGGLNWGASVESRETDCQNAERNSSNEANACPSNWRAICHGILPAFPETSA